MSWDAANMLGLFMHTLGYWWVIIPSVLLGIVVGAIPGLNAANSIILLLPLTLAMDPEVGLMFMVSLYCATHLGGGDSGDPDQRSGNRWRRGEHS